MILHAMFLKFRSNSFLCSIDGAGGTGSGSGATVSAPAGNGGDAADAGSAGSSAPSGVPAAGTSDARESTERDDDVFSGFEDAPDDVDVVEVQPTAPTPAPSIKRTPPPGAPVPPAQAQPQAPAAHPAVQPQAQPQPPVPVAPPGPQPQPAQESQEPEPLSAAEPGQIAASLEANREAAIAHLAKVRFALTPEEITGLEENAGEAVPKLLAKVFVESQINAMRFMSTSVPALVKQGIETQMRISRNENDFYTHWKGQIKKSEHHALVGQYARGYRAANPRATKVELITAVGHMVLSSLGRQALPVNQAPGAQALPNGNGHAAARQVHPFVPAVGGAGGPQQPNAGDSDPWGGMAGDYDEG